jgi:NADP-dependent 3-hydroxy acid dehydrogenase YdfG
MTTSENIDHDHLLLIGAGPGVGTAIVRRFGREGFRATLIAQNAEKLEQLAEELRGEGIGIETVVADIADLSSYRTELETIYGAEDAPGVVVYNASMMAPDDILTSSVEHLRAAHDVDVLGGVVAAQVVAPALVRPAGGRSSSPAAASPTTRCPRWRPSRWARPAFVRPRP